MRRAARVLFVALLMCATLAANGLKMDDPAPPLDIATWIKGTPVASLDEPRKLYLIHFWNTENDTCRENIPVLTRLQAKFKDKAFTVIAIATNAEPGEVKSFVEHVGAGIGYTVATDNGGRTAMAYTKTTQGFPFAFLVGGGGKVLWYGLPWDLEFDGAIDSFIEAGTDPTKLQAAMRHADHQKETRELSDVWSKEYLIRCRYGYDKAAADEAGQKLLNYPGVDAGVLGNVAGTILERNDLAYRDVSFALKLAEEACRRTESKDVRLLGIYCGALSESGKRKEAEERLRKALSLATEPDEQTALKRYLTMITAHP